MVGRRGWYCQKGHVASCGPAPGCQSWRCQTTKPWHEGHTVTPWEKETRTLLSECLAWRFLSHVKPYLKTPDEEPAVESPQEAAGGSGDWLGMAGGSGGPSEMALWIWSCLQSLYLVLK